MFANFALTLAKRRTMTEVLPVELIGSICWLDELLLVFHWNISALTGFIQGSANRINNGVGCNTFAIATTKDFKVICG